jgi:hypothetical protein
VALLLAHPARLPHLTWLTHSLLLANPTRLPDPAGLPRSGLLRKSGGSKDQGPHDCCACGKRLQINAAGLYRHLVTPLCCRVHSVDVVVGRTEDNGWRHCEFRSPARYVG